MKWRVKRICVLLLLMACYFLPAQHDRQLSEKEIDYYIDLIRSGRGDPLSTIILLGRTGSPRALGVIIDALKTGRYPQIRFFAARALGNYRSTPAVKALEAALDDEHWLVRTWSAEALGSIACDESAAGLIRCFRDSQEYVRFAALSALGKMNSPAVQEALYPCLNDEDALIRTLAAAALHRQNGTGGPIILDALKDPSASVRKTAARVLSETPFPEAVNGLFGALEDGECLVRCYAGNALDRFCSWNSVVMVRIEFGMDFPAGPEHIFLKTESEWHDSLEDIEVERVLPFRGADQVYTFVNVSPGDYWLGFTIPYLLKEDPAGGNRVAIHEFVMPELLTSGSDGYAPHNLVTIGANGRQDIVLVMKTRPVKRSGEAQDGVGRVSFIPRQQARSGELDILDENFFPFAVAGFFRTDPCPEKPECRRILFLHDRFVR